MVEPDKDLGWCCYDDNGKLIAWFADMADAVLWLTKRGKLKAVAECARSTPSRKAMGE